MNWPSHLAFGLVLYAAFIFSSIFFGYHLEVLTIAIGAIITIPYALLPDIDHDMSKISQVVEILFLGATVVAIAGYFYSKKEELLMVAGFLVALLFVTKFLRHRGITHTIRFGIAAALPLALANPLYAVFAFIAFMSHLAADMHLKL
ncbi:MAG: hypothetical protein COV47_00660 [Candidatus Diapherotrites archaeon CG11_big_fil_rev_8_21_14_0_20_37_9]|nr:MAG: hypothetical protein COV47_00660 [Candidatus Diapherotrites archaeon CG11_big_fil_rev_8_21_14_0_20_37_9]